MSLADDVGYDSLVEERKAPVVEQKVKCSRCDRHAPTPGSELQFGLQERFRTLEAQAMAGARGGKCLSLSVKDHTAFIEWECKRSHRWFNTHCMIMCYGFWCPNCPEDDRKNIKTVLNMYQANLFAKLEAGEMRGKQDGKQDGTRAAAKGPPDPKALVPKALVPNALVPNDGNNP